MTLTLKKTILLLGFLSLLLSIILMCAVPPVSRDALTHHLAVPKLYAQNNGIHEFPEIIPSYYPQLVDLIYCLPMITGNDIVPKYIHFLFALLTGLSIFFYLQKKLNGVYGLLAATFFLSLPVIVKLSITVYVDLGLIFFSTVSLLGIIKWYETKFKFRWLIISAVFCGLALSTKYNGLISCFLLTVFTPMIYLKNKKSSHDENIKESQLKAIGYAMSFFIISMAIFSPWMIKNYTWTKNPIYPLYDNVFNPEDQIDIEQKNTEASMNHFLIRKYIHKESWVDTATIPIRIFFQGKDDNPKFFDGKLNPLLFLLPFFAFAVPIKGSAEDNTPKKIMLFFSVLYILIVFFRQDMRIRWIGPAIPPLVILSAYGLKNIFSFFEQAGEKKSKLRYSLLKFIRPLLLLSIFITASLNAVYIYQLFVKVDPLPYLTGDISRSQYIEKFRPEYTALEYANQNLGEDTHILAFFLGNRMYYSDHDIKFNYPILKKIAETSKKPEEILTEFKKRNVTTLIVNHLQFNDWVDKGFNDKEKNLIQLFFNRHTQRLFFKNGHGVYQLISN